MKLRQDHIEQNEARQEGMPPVMPAPRTSRNGNRDAGFESIDTRRAPAMAIDPGAQRTFGGLRAEAERTLGGNDLVNESYLELALLAAQPVCRVSVLGPDSRFDGHATGFLVSPHVLLTNWHVFRTRDEAQNSYVEFDYRQDLRGREIAGHRFALRPGSFFLNDRELDYALVAVAPISDDGRTPLSRYGYHRLGSDSEIGRWMTIIQHPSGQPRQFAIRENERVPPPDGVEDARFIWYKSDTAQGSSGAPVFDDGFRVVALHHYGRARKDGNRYVLRDGRMVDSLDGIEDTLVDWVANEGVCTFELVIHIRQALGADASLGGSEHGRELLAALDGAGDIITRARGGELELARRDEQPTQPFTTTSSAGAGMSFNVGQISVAQMFVGGQPNVAPPAVAPHPVLPPVLPPPRTIDAQAEVTKPPILDTHYSNRKGYRTEFLGNGLPVDMPEVIDMSLVSKLDNGEHQIPYQHFSVVMNKRRRLAIYTASNVDYRPSTHPKGSDYTRNTLGGYAKNDREAWVTDPRIPEEHQLPDHFYNVDRQAFDKGHIVKREDVCFGSTYAVIQRANGDTYHVTNCSPQVKGFNQSGEQGIWGLFENHIGRQSKSEKLCIFAGPVFDDDDPVFHGQDDRGAVQIQIPQSFWKVVVARVGNELRSFGFHLEQDLSDVRFTEQEFDVGSGDWVESMIAIDELGELVGLRFDPAIVAADQHGQIGEEEFDRARVRHRPRNEPERAAMAAPAPDKPATDKPKRGRRA
jgi:endonuclease G